MIYLGQDNTNEAKAENLNYELRVNRKLKRADILFDSSPVTNSFSSVDGNFGIYIIGNTVKLSYLGAYHSDIRRRISKYEISGGYISNAIVNRMLAIKRIASGLAPTPTPAESIAPIVIDAIEEAHYKTISEKRAKYQETEAERAAIFQNLKDRLISLNKGTIESEVINEYVNFVTQDGAKYKIYAEPTGVIVKTIEMPNMILDVNSLNAQSLIPSMALYGSRA